MTSRPLSTFFNLGRGPINHAWTVPVLRTKSAEKLAQRQKILEEEQALQREILGYIHNGTLDLAALDRPVSPSVRTVLLSWVATANLSPDHRGQTQYGQRYKLQKRGNRNCRLICTDGTLTMPDCVLVFEEVGHE